MRSNYINGNYGYGHAKQALYEVVLERFGEAREKFDYYMNNLNELDEALAFGAEKAKKVADGVLERVRAKWGIDFKNIPIGRFTPFRHTSISK